MKRIAIIVLITIGRLPVSATIINIPDDYRTIQQGIDASTDGDTVLVQPGTYVENINFNGHNIVLGSLFLTTDDTAYIAETVIDGDSAGSVIIFNNAENYDATLKGFTLRSGTATSGGGIYCASADPAIFNNRIINNSAEFGGGIYFYNSTSIIANNYISGNFSMS